MRTIHKYELKINDELQGFSLPHNSGLIHFGEQDGQLFMWVEVNTTEKEYSDCVFFVVGTGQEIDQDGVSQHCKTVQMSNGLVWHIYEIFK